MKIFLALLTFVLSLSLLRTQPSHSQCPVLEEHIDYYGNDITFIFASTPQHCCTLCIFELDCVGFTFINFTRACWLKSNNLTVLRLSSIGSKQNWRFYIYFKLFDFYFQLKGTSGIVIRANTAISSTKIITDPISTTTTQQTTLTTTELSTTSVEKETIIAAKVEASTSNIIYSVSTTSTSNSNSL